VPAFLAAHYVSPLAGVIAGGAAMLLHEPWPVIVFATAAALAVVVLHRPNISRLRAGTETRFRFRRTRPPQPVKN
jgi:glycerol-3-phosphate acyltransferase PlsY